MPYVLGVDVGVSRTAAAVCRLDGASWSDVEPVRLGEQSSLVASVLHLAEDGSFIVGDAAGQRGLAEPDRVARGFGQRVGDDVPMVVGGELFDAAELTAALIAWVAEEVEAQHNTAAERIVVTHRASWGAHRKRALHEALRQVGLANVTLLPEPIAAGESFAYRNRVDDGDSVAVYELGSGTFCSSVVRRTSSGVFELLGCAETADPVGGSRFDDALVNQLIAELGADPDRLDPASQQDRMAMSRLRQECAVAKEKLSTSGDVSIPVALPGVRTEARMRRAVFSELIRPTVEGTIEELRRTMSAASIAPGQLDAVVLTGGSARIPLVTELMSEALPCQIAVEGDPALTTARGAALAGRLVIRSSAGAIPPPPEMTIALARVEDSEPPKQVDLPGEELAVIDDEPSGPPPRPAVDIEPLELPVRRTVLRPYPGAKPGVIGAVIAVIVVVGVALTFYFQAGTKPSGSSPSPAGQLTSQTHKTITREVPPPGAPGESGAPAPSGSGKPNQEDTGR